MTHLALIGISLILGLVHGGAFGEPGAALSQFFAAALFATLVFLMQRHPRRTWVLAIAVFWLASYTVGLRWLAFGLMSAHALGTLLGALVYALAVIGLSSTSIVSMTLGWFVFARLKMPVNGHSRICCSRRINRSDDKEECEYSNNSTKQFRGQVAHIIVNVGPTCVSAVPTNNFSVATSLRRRKSFIAADTVFHGSGSNAARYSDS